MLAFLKKHYFLMLIAIFVALGVVAVFLVLTGKDEVEQKIIDPDQGPPTADFEADYSNLDEIIPGEHMREDVEKIAGLPYSIATLDNILYMYYKTPVDAFTEFDNIVGLRNGVVFFVLENVFSDYRGGYSDYTAKYGEPSVVFYQPANDDWPIHVFLDAGIALESSNLIDVTKVLYFVPQSETAFTYRVANLFGWETEIHNHEETYTGDL